MRLIIGLFSAFLTIFPASALTLYNSQDPNTQSASSRASEQLNHSFSKLFEVLAAVERRSFEDAEKLKAEAVKQLQDSSKLFVEAAHQASDKKVSPIPRDEEDKQTIRRMMELSLQYKAAYNDFGEFSEKLLFEQIGRILSEFASALSDFSPYAFVKDERAASRFLLRAIRLQDFGRITTAYLAIPRIAN